MDAPLPAPAGMLDNKPSENESGRLEAILRRDRAVVLTGLVSIAALSWAYTWYLAWDMQHSPRAICCVSQLFMFAMWVIMMVAMMVPSATPMILLFAKVNRKRR